MVERSVNNVKEIGKKKCSTRGCVNKANALIDSKEFCTKCFNMIKMGEVPEDWLLRLGK